MSAGRRTRHVGPVGHGGDLARGGESEPGAGTCSGPERDGAAGGRGSGGDDDEARPAVHVPVDEGAARAFEEVGPGSQVGLVLEPPGPRHTEWT